MDRGCIFGVRFSGRALFLLLILLLSIKGPKSSAFTHWVLTDHGKIQSQINSVFHMRRPHDLVGLMRQEQRVDYLQNLKYDMTEQKLDAVEKRHDVTLEARLFTEDEDCVKAKRSLSEYDLYVSAMIFPDDDSGIFSEYNFDDTLKEPECYDPNNVFKLEILDELEGVVDDDIDGLGELALKPDLLGRKNISFREFGHLVERALHSKTFDKARWKAYLYAGAYWRVNGKPSKAIECLRRSYNAAPDHVKYLPLISLGSVLHRARYSEDAAIVLTLALGLGGHDANVYFTLGNVRAVMLDLNQSVEAYKMADMLMPDMSDVRERMHAVLCHQKIEQALERQQEELKETLKELREYKRQHEDWTQVLNKIVDEQASLDVRLRSRLDYETNRMVMNKGKSGKDCFQITSNGHRYITCSLDSKNDIHSGILAHVSTGFEDVQPVLNVESVDIDDLVRKLETRAEAIALTSTSDIPKKGRDLDEIANFPLPSLDDCDNIDSSIKHLTQMDNALPWEEAPFISPEERGFDVQKTFSEDIGLERDELEPLPWIPPTCEHFSGRQKYEKLSITSQVKINRLESEVEAKYSSYSPENSMQEMGARVKKAVKSGVKPKWVPYLMAGTHWRVFGTVQKAVTCFKHALYHVPSKFKNIVLTNLAATLFKAEAVNDALTVIGDSVELKSDCLEANYLMGNILMMKGNFTGAMETYQKIIKVSPEFKKAKELWRHAYCLNEKLALKGDQYDCILKDGVKLCTKKTVISGNYMKCFESGKCIPMADDEIEEQKLKDQKRPQPKISEKKKKAKKKGKKKVQKNKSKDVLEQKIVEIKSPMMTALNAPGPDGQQTVSELIFISNSKKQFEVHVINQIPSGPEMMKDAFVVGAICQTTMTIEEKISHTLLGRQTLKDEPLSELYEKPHLKPVPKIITHEYCRKIAMVDWSSFTSTLMSVGAKGILLYPDKYDDAQTTLRLPHCRPVPGTMYIPDHLEGIKRRRILVGVKEMGLARLFLSLANNFSVDQSTNIVSVASRIARQMIESPNSWALSAMASLYWRLEGDAEEAIECARHSIYHAPPEARDVGLLSISNVLFGAKLYNDAMVTGQAAFDISGDKYSLLHFHLANIYHQLGNTTTAIWFYEEALRMNPSFNEAQRRADILRCLANDILIL